MPDTPAAEQAAAYRRGMLRAAEIAEDMQSSKPDEEGHAISMTCRKIASAIRAEAGEEQSHDR